MEATFKISAERILAVYHEKEEFINDCKGDKNLEFGSEIFKKNTIFPWKNYKLKVIDIDIEIESILSYDRERISDHKKANVVVTIFVNIL